MKTRVSCWALGFYLVASGSSWGLGPERSKAVIETSIAQDISGEITEQDLALVHELVSSYLVDSIPEKLQVQSATAHEGGRSLQVGFDAPHSRFGQDSTYQIQFFQESEQAPWALRQIMIRGQHTLAGYDKPIFSMGALTTKTMSEVVEHVSRFWAEAEVGRMEVKGVSSNDLPPLHMYPEALGAMPNRGVYNVHVVSLEQHQRPGSVLMDQSASLGTIGFSGSQEYSVRLSRDLDGRLVTTDVYVSGFPADQQSLERLRRNLEQPSDPQEAEDLKRAARATLPASARGADLQMQLTMLMGQTEMFMLGFAEAPISDRRRAAGMVSCARTAGTNSEWQCNAQFTSASQLVPGQPVPVQLHAIVAHEDAVDELVEELRTAFAAHPSVDASDQPIEISIISADRSRWSAHFQAGRAFYEGLFSYDDKVEVLSVELRHRMEREIGQ